MISRTLMLLSLPLLLSSWAMAQVMESHVDFTVSPGVILDGEIQYSQEWLKTTEFKNKEMRMIDVAGVAKLHPNNIQLVAAKLAFVSKKSFEQLARAEMNTSDFTSEMLDSVGIRALTADSWRVTNRVKAYGLPFKVSFDYKFKEVSAKSLGAAASFLKSEADGLKGTGRERFLTLDMSNFSMLMYRNYAVVYVKEISADETMVVAGIIAGIDIRKARGYFPMGARNPMLNNMKTQTMNMARNIQQAK